MRMNTANIARNVKYGIFVAGVLFNVVLAFFPEALPEQVQDRVLISFTVCTVVAVLLALEELKLLLQEQNDKTHASLKQLDDHALANEINRTLRKIEESGDQLFYKLARESVQQAEGVVKRAEHGEIVLDQANTAAIGIELANNVQLSLQATSLWDFDPLHGGGKSEYLQRLAMAVDVRQVAIQRLFIIQPGAQNEPKFLERLRLDTDAGVEVKYLFAADWAPTHAVIDPVDFGIWDGGKVWIGHREPNIFATKQLATLHNDRSTVALYEKVFRANWDKGVRIAGCRSALKRTGT